MHGTRATGRKTSQVLRVFGTRTRMLLVLELNRMVVDEGDDGHDFWCEEGRLGRQ